MLKKNFSIYFLIAIFVVFLFVRFLNLTSFSIFSDESIYLQYSQLIHEDFAKYKYISMDNVFNDWKAPLQYWVGSVFMPISEDPVAAGRTASVIFSILGLIGVYYGVKQLYDEKTAIIAGITFALIPASVYVGIRYMADIFVLSSAALLLYGFVKILTAPAEKIPWSDIGVALLAGIMLLLSKQSGVLYFYVFIFLPFFFFFEVRKEWKRKKEGEELSKKERNVRIEKKKVWQRNIGIFAGVWISSFLLYKMILPARIFARDIYIRDNGHFR